MALSGNPLRVAVAGVSLDAASYNALTRLIEGVSGAMGVGNVDRYVGAEREVGRTLEQGHTRICVIDFDHNYDEALWITERLRNDFPEISVFALSSQPDL